MINHPAGACFETQVGESASEAEFQPISGEHLLGLWVSKGIKVFHRYWQENDIIAPPFICLLNCYNVALLCELLTWMTKSDKYMRKL